MSSVPALACFHIGLLHNNHWFLIEEGGGAGIGWQLHCFLNAPESCSIGNIYMRVQRLLDLNPEK